PDNLALDVFAARRIDRMRDVRVQLGPAVGAAQRPILVELGAAIIAMARSQVILATAGGAAIGELAARHRHERALGAFDDLQIADDEAIVKRDRAEVLEPFVVVVHELDANFGDNHRKLLFLPWISWPL